MISSLAEERGHSIEEERQRWIRMRDRYRESHADKYAEVLRRRAARKKDDWDVYVDEFVEKHKLDDRKQVVAARILERAKTMRDVYREKQDGSREQEKYDAIENRIFDRMLVRNLKRLR